LRKGAEMTKAFLETIVLRPENEKRVLSAFSKKNLKKIKVFDAQKVKIITGQRERKLSLQDLSL